MHSCQNIEHIQLQTRRKKYPQITHKNKFHLYTLKKIQKKKNNFIYNSIENNKGVLFVSEKENRDSGGSEQLPWPFLLIILYKSFIIEKCEHIQLGEYNEPHAQAIIGF